eukprot:TRINITY_DN124_c4_g1_i1.p1 TRINITY_DN124_c4_g1~~TRINITY_DN124_c4_g1_i1.p1  ORF type:complete len:749 (+),score=285.01 TRINITY_DN124_c4_g1_i1:90-2336(+)
MAQRHPPEGRALPEGRPPPVSRVPLAPPSSRCGAAAAAAAPPAPAASDLEEAQFPPERLLAENRPYISGLSLWLPDDRKGMLNGCFTDRKHHCPAEADFASWPRVVQEVHFTRGVLAAMMGVRCHHIGTREVAEKVPPGRKYRRIAFAVDEAVDDAHSGFAEPLLQIAADRALVYRFAKEMMSQFTCGLTNMAFGAGLLNICHEMSEAVCQVWKQIDAGAAERPLNLARSQLLHWDAVFRLLTDIVDKHEGKQGNGVIRLLEEFHVAQLGDPRGTAAVEELLQYTCVPFFRMLSGWIYEGEEPVERLALNIHKGAKSDDLVLFRERKSPDDFMRWELTPNNLPLFLKQLAAKVLKCGKLALMLQRCDVHYSPTADQICYVPDPGYYVPIIESAYKQANGALLSHLHNKCQLLKRLRFYKDFILCGHSVWLKTFLDSCDKNPNAGFERAWKQARWEVLQQMGRAAIGAEFTKLGYPKSWIDDLALMPAENSLVKIVKNWSRIEKGEELGRSGSANYVCDALTALKLECQCEWPLSLVLEWGESQVKYQFLGRVVMRIKGLLHALLRHRSRLHVPKSREEVLAQRRFSALRHRMIGFLKSLELYLMFEVIEPRFANFIEKVTVAGTVEEITHAHREFLMDSLAAAMAASQGLYIKIEHAFLSCKLFSEAAKVIKKEGTIAHGKTDPCEAYKDTVDRFEVQFDERLGGLLQDLAASGEGPVVPEEHRHLRQVLKRIDFNKHYKRTGKYREE